MKVNLAALTKLQNIDRELEALEALKGDLPQQVQKLRNELEDTRNTYEAQKQALTEVRKSRTLLEGELKVLQEKSNKYQEQLYAVTSNREYDAITVEIDTIAEKISETEDKILELLEQEEQLSEDIKRVEPNLSSLEENLSEKEKELKDKIQETENEYQSFQRQRQKLVNNIKQAVLYQYERIRKGIGNSAVAEIRNSACSGCFSSIPPQKQVEIRMMNQLIFCESCGRILIFSGDKETVAG